MTVNQKNFDVNKIRADFPIFSRQVYGKPLIYLDNAATTQKPKQVIDRISKYYQEENSNIHRGVFCLSEQATAAYESTRHKIQLFLGADSSKEIIFVRGATEGINLVASSFGQKYIKAQDEILITAMEHHANIVPWQMLCERTGAVLKVIPMNDRGELILENLQKLISKKTKMAALTQVSNVLGTVNPVKEIIQQIRNLNPDIKILIDGAQGVPHMKVNVKDLDADFYVFSGHKIYGPTGVGVLYGKAKILDAMPPYQGGGDMIASVTLEKTIFNSLPYKFEAGTPHIAGVIALGEALDYLSKVGLDAIHEYEIELTRYAENKLQTIPGLQIIGNANDKIGAVSFFLGAAHAHDIGTILDREGIAIRAGHHCAMPVMDFYKIPATARASFAFYNTKEEADLLAQALLRVQEIFK